MKLDYTFAELSAMPPEELQAILDGMLAEQSSREHKRWAICGRIIQCQEELAKPEDPRP